MHFLNFIGFLGAILIVEKLIFYLLGAYPRLKFIISLLIACLMIELATHAAALTGGYGWLAAIACFFFFCSKVLDVGRACLDAERKAAGFWNAGGLRSVKRMSKIESGKLSEMEVAVELEKEALEIIDRIHGNGAMEVEKEALQKEALEKDVLMVPIVTMLMIIYSLFAPSVGFGVLPSLKGLLVSIYDTSGFLRTLLTIIGWLGILRLIRRLTGRVDATALH